MRGEYKVALIGCGGRGKQHAAAIKADPRCRVVALVDVNAQAAEALAKEYGFDDAAVFTAHAPMLAEHHPHIVAASLWTPLHLSTFRDCALAGVRAVMSEKPMAPTWGECQEMARIVEQTGCQLTFSHQRRFAKGNRWLREQLTAGRFGKVERMDLYSPHHLLDCGTHTIDQAMSFNEESPAKWVLGGIDTRELINIFGVKSEAMAIGTIVFQNGVRASLQVGGPDMDIWGGVRVMGTEGFFEVIWDGQIKRAVVYAEPAWQPPADFADTGTDHMTAMVCDAIDCLESGRESEVSHRSALRSAEMIFSLYESVRRNARIELPLQGVSDNPFTSMLEAGKFATAQSPA